MPWKHEEMQGNPPRNLAGSPCWQHNFPGQQCVVIHCPTKCSPAYANHPIQHTHSKASSSQKGLVDRAHTWWLFLMGIDMSWAYHVGCAARNLYRKYKMGGFTLGSVCRLGRYRQLHKRHIWESQRHVQSFCLRNHLVFLNAVHSSCT